MCLGTSAPGGPRLDAARSIDLLAARDAVAFLPKMRPEVASTVKDLEAWVGKQQTGLDLAARSSSGEGLQGNTEQLLKVSEAWA